ncbi:MAG: pyruvate dehydrogenase complex dihydrolipoamide acetyltransferase [Chitinophagales bacterium]|nr:pyruvate dehydrogenase complex dihydrolipoamide acetyltransferase [Chitinophagales bacterium]
MAEVIRMPKMSDTMTEGVIVSWHKKTGDKVKSGDLLAEIETDKAVMEFESYQEGTLLYIGAEKGATIKVDDVIAVLGKEGEDYKAALNNEKKPDEQNGKLSEEQAPEKMPEAQKSAQETIIEKAPASIPPSTSNKEISSNNNQQQPKEPEVINSDAVNGERIKASPLAKKIAGDEGISLEKLKGSGDEGRIIKRDIEKYLSQAAGGKQPQETSLNADVESYEEVPLSQMRKTIARRLVESKFSAPHFYLTTEINMDRCTESRAALNAVNPEKKISFNDIIIKAVALALKKHPQVNSSWLGDRIRYNHHVNIGMAVAVEEGLLVPVIKFADLKLLSQISEEAKAFAARAKEKKLQPEEMQGNTFTISNLGMMDIDNFTAIINPPDACILAIGKIKKVPAVLNDQVKIVNMLKVTMSCDHRVVDGARGARFLETVKSFLENPLSMLY